ncbi:MAG: glycerol kinase GlpK [Acidobacteriota bacterium]
MPAAVLAVDQGTTGTTAVVLGPDGSVLSRAYRELPQHFPQPGWVEHDPEQIWRSVVEAITETIALAPIAARDLAALGLTNQRETTVVWERASGRPVYPAIVWQSRQTAELCRQLERDGHAENVQRRTGLVIDAYFSGTKVRWILDRDPTLRRRAERGELCFGTVDSWLLWRLTAGAVHATDPTNACRTLLFNIHRQAWDDDLLELLAVPRAMLPKVAPASAHRFGETAAVDGLPAGVPIAGIAGDQQAALYGQGCHTVGAAKNTYGTGCFLVMHTGDAPAETESGLLTSLACDPRGEPAYCLEGSIFSTGSSVQWLRDAMGLIDDAAQSEALARSVEDTAGVYMVPALSGLGAPYWDMDARGMIWGLTRGSGRAHVVRAVLESIAYRSRDVLDLMSEEAGCDLEKLRVDGGACANDFLMQFQADITAVPIERPRMIETTVLGAAFLAGLEVGFWSDPSELDAARRLDRRFEPAMDVERREALYAGWREAVERALSRS